MFGYDSAITERFPTIRAGVVHATGLWNRPSTPDLLARYQIEQRNRAESAAEIPITTLPQIVAWRRVFTAFGAKPTQHRNAAEALLRRLNKHGDIPTISTLVDLGNLVSIRHAMPVAVFDVRRLAGSVTVRFADGTEPFADLGSSESMRPEPGEVVFVDEDDVVCARRWCWRQSAPSATSADTVDALFVVEGHHESAEADVEMAAGFLIELLGAHQPGAQTEWAALSPVDPSVEVRPS